MIINPLSYANSYRIDGIKSKVRRESTEKQLQLPTISSKPYH